MIDGDLGSFLRSRREALSPADVGIPVGSRRRTPGLRRAELATLAGVSVDYLIRLEQGRDTHPSSQVLAALAEVLQLSEDDLAHLRTLSVISNGPELCPTPAAPARAVRSSVHALLDQLEPAPAFVINHLADLLAWTEGYDRLARPLGILDEEQPNLMSFTFTNPRARTAYASWSDVADEQIANLRAETREPGDDARLFADRLAAIAGADFTERWERRMVTRKRSGVRTVVHPTVGKLRLAFETLELSDADRQRLVVYIPADEASSAGLDQLAGRTPGGLRSVSAG